MFLYEIVKDQSFHTAEKINHPPRSCGGIPSSPRVKYAFELGHMLFTVTKLAKTNPFSTVIASFYITVTLIYDFSCG